MEKIGVIKDFDKLGRLVIPKSMRERYGIMDKAEIVATKDGILIKNPEFILVRASSTKKDEEIICK